MMGLEYLGWPDIIVALVAAQRVGELVIARRNTAALLSNGAYEVGRGHYPTMVIMHGAWLIIILVTVNPETPINGLFLAAFILLQGLRIWIISTLGKYWTTRIIVVPDVPLVTSGPYRYFRHPNYWIVIAEIAVFPLIFGLWQVAAIFTVLNAVVLYFRIRVEN